MKLIHHPQSYFSAWSRHLLFADIYFQYFCISEAEKESPLFGSLASLQFEIALICGIIWVLMFMTKKISSLSALTMLAVMPWLFIIVPWVQNISFSGYQFMIMFALSGLMIYKHRENIGRLLSGQEGKLKSETRSEETK